MRGQLLRAIQGDAKLPNELKNTPEYLLHHFKRRILILNNITSRSKALRNFKRFTVSSRDRMSLENPVEGNR